MVELTEMHLSSITFSIDPKRGCFTLEFPFSNFIVAEVKQLPTARWNKSGGRWELALSRGVYEALQEFTGQTLPEVDRVLKKRSSKAIDLSKHNFHTTPYTHQREAIGVTLKRFGFKVEVKEDADTPLNTTLIELEREGK